MPASVPNFVLPFPRAATLQKAPASLINNMEEWIEYLADFVNVSVMACRSSSAGVSVPNNSLGPVEFDTIEVDTDHMCLSDTSTNRQRIYITVPGTYVMTANIVYLANNGGSTRGSYIIKNDTETIGNQAQPPYSASSVTASPCCAVVRAMDIGDWVTLGAFQNSGGALGTKTSADTGGGFPVTRLTACRVGLSP